MFDIEYDDGSRTTANRKIMREGCSVNWTWIDDGIYSILVTVYDEEGDETTDSIEVEILNRGPSVSIMSQRSQVKVEHPVTLYVFANDSDSEDAWPGLVDIHWPTAKCEEGYYTREYAQLQRGKKVCRHSLLLVLTMMVTKPMLQ